MYTLLPTKDGWDSRKAACFGVSQKEVFESLQMEGGKEPSPNPPLCHAGVFVAEHVSKVTAES